MGISPERNLRPKVVERRRARRSTVSLPGVVFCPQKSLEIACTVKDISPAGAGIECACELPPRTAIVLYAKPLGRFEGQIVTRTGKHVSIRFAHSERMQKKIIDKLIHFLEGRNEDVSRLREARRIYEPAMRTFTCFDGRIMECNVADVSLSGASLKTDARPPIGEVIQIGCMTGRVVRHHDYGIGIEFLERHAQTAMLSNA